MAQVFWMKEPHGQPARFFVGADRELTIASDFANFGSDIAQLRKKLRGLGGEIFDSFPPYGVGSGAVSESRMIRRWSCFIKRSR